MSDLKPVVPNRPVFPLGLAICLCILFSTIGVITYGIVDKNLFVHYHNESYLAPGECELVSEPPDSNYPYRYFTKFGNKNVPYPDNYKFYRCGVDQKAYTVHGFPLMKHRFEDLRNTKLIRTTRHKGPFGMRKSTYKAMGWDYDL